MSVYYYLTCHECKVQMPFISTKGVLRPLSDDPWRVIHFVMDHHRHGIEVVQEQDARCDDYTCPWEDEKDIEGTTPVPRRPPAPEVCKLTEVQADIARLHE